ncbi:UNKNOWN [Stylonychia lemnae]|uniref:Uncharacterized protein n=1 Tax=Stylonychia lemnae TaxID=5949 RepID=A0A078AKS0_STYLE|nr:UNKNOWN [Stylonychia lemnae]|eukprot:CDW82970.1 UNKNOWN [Stylonychia lemnae]
MNSQRTTQINTMTAQQQQKVDSDTVQNIKIVQRNASVLKEQIDEVLARHLGDDKTYKDFLSQLMSLSQGIQTLKNSQNITFQNQILFPKKNFVRPEPVTMPDLMKEAPFFLDTTLYPTENQILDNDEIAKDRPTDNQINQILRQMLSSQNEINLQPENQLIQNVDNQQQNVELTQDDYKQAKQIIDDKINSQFNPKIDNMIAMLNENMRELRNVKNLRGRHGQNDMGILSQSDLEQMDTQMDEPQLLQVADNIFELLYKGMCS